MSEACCVVCGTPRSEFPRDNVVLGELTRTDINHDRQERGLGPFCGSHSCKLELSDEMLDMYSTIRPAARFGGSGCHEL